MQDFQHTPLRDIQKWSPAKPRQSLFDTLFVFQRPEAEDEDFAKDIWTEVNGKQVADVSLEASMFVVSMTVNFNIVPVGLRGQPES